MKAAIKLAAQIGLIALCLTPVVRQLVNDWGAISLLAARLQLPVLLASAGLLILSSLFLPVAMSRFTRGGPSRIGYRDSALAYFGSQPMKYLPGSFWILPGRVVLLGRLGHESGLASGGLLFEMVAQALSAALVAALLLGAAGMAAVGWTAGVWLALGGSLLFAGLLLALPGLVGRMKRAPQMLRAAVAQLAEIPVSARARNLALTVAAFSAMWLVMGGSFYLLTVASDPRFDLELLRIAAGISTLSWLVGFLAPFSPGGIGVREGAIVLLLNALAPSPETALIALLSRAVSLLVELAFAGGAWLILRRAPRRNAVSLSVPSAFAYLSLRPLRYAMAEGGNRPLPPQFVRREQSMKKKSTKKAIRLIAIALVALAVAAGAYLYFRPTEVNASTTTSTATVTRGTLSATVEAAGNIQSHQTADLAFGQSGTVKAITVSVGDQVKAGETLAELDTTELDLSLQSAQVSLENAQATLAKTQTPATEEEIATAKAQLASAQAAYDKLKAGPTAAELATAQAQLASAQAAYEAAAQSAASGDSSLQSAAAALEKATLTLQQAQGAYDRISWRGDVGMSSEAQALQTATIEYNTAKASYEALAATSKTDATSKVASAAASLKSAQANLTSVKNSISAADLASAEAALTQAQSNLDTLLAGADANDVTISQNSVKSAQIALEQAQLKLAQAKIVAPFDGVVTAVSIKVGQTASGTAISMADLSNLEVVVNMSEVDVNQIKVGQKADVTLDAVADAALEGAVTAIAPTGAQSSGVVNYPVTVSLTNTSDAVKTGMTANLSIIVDERENVLTVPNRAIKTVNRQKVVTVLRGDQQIQVPVEIGLSSDSLTEVVSGLNEGDVVLTSGATTTTSATTNAAGAGALGAMTGGAPMGAGGPPPGN